MIQQYYITVPYNENLRNCTTDADGLITLGELINPVIPTDSGVFQLNCLLNVFGVGIIQNVGTVAVPSWNVLTGGAAVVFITNGFTVDLNDTSDQIIPVIGTGSMSFTSYYAKSPSTALNIVDDVEIWTGPGRTGIHVTTIGQSSSTLSTGWGGLTADGWIGSLSTNGTRFSVPNLYLSVGTPQGAPATARLLLLGIKK